HDARVAATTGARFTRYQRRPRSPVGGRRGYPGPQGRAERGAEITQRPLVGRGRSAVAGGRPLGVTCCAERPCLVATAIPRTPECTAGRHRPVGAATAGSATATSRPVCRCARTG